MHLLLDKHDHLDERQFQLAVRRLADSLSYGTDGSPFLGAGIEYVQSRPYVAGDPIKSIDWRITARTGRVHVKDYEAPKRLPVYILVDTSASMVATSQKLSKYAWAVQLAGGLALSSLNRISPVGLLGCGSGELHIRPSLSRSQVFQWLYRLRRHRADETTALGKKLRNLVPSLPNRSVLIVLSDLHDPDAVSAIKLAAQEHDTLVLQLIDPAERSTKGSGFYRGVEAETETEFVGHGQMRWDHSLQTQQHLKEAGIDHLLLHTDEPFIPRLRGFLRKRDSLGKAKL